MKENKKGYVSSNAEWNYKDYNYLNLIHNKLLLYIHVDQFY